MKLIIYLQPSDNTKKKKCLTLVNDALHISAAAKFASRAAVTTGESPEKVQDPGIPWNIQHICKPDLWNKCGRFIFCIYHLLHFVFSSVFHFP